MDPSLWHNPRGNSNVPPFCAPRPFWCFLFCFVWNKIFCCWFRYRFLWNVSVGISGLESSLFLFIFFTTSSSSFAISAIVSFDLFVFFPNGRSPKGRRFCRSATLTRSRPITTATTATTTTTTATTATATTATTTATAMATTTKPNNKNLRAGSSFFFCV